MITQRDNRGSGRTRILGLALLSLALASCTSTPPAQARYPDAAAGKAEAVRAILDQGKDPNQQTENGRTLLHQAVQNGHVDSVELLLNRGADPNLKDKEGLSPTFLASRSRPEILKPLLAKGGRTDLALKDGSTMLHLCALCGPTNTAAYLLDLGFDPNVRRANGQTPLHAAAMNPYPQMVAYLASRGAGVDATDKSGCTPLMLASTTGRSNNCAALLQAGANLNAANQAGLTPLQCSIVAGEFDTAGYLIRVGARMPTPGSGDIDDVFCHGLYAKLLGDYFADAGQAAQSTLSYRIAADELNHARQEYADEVPRALHKAEVRERWKRAGYTALYVLAVGASSFTYSAMDAGLQQSNHRLYAQASALHEARSTQEYFALYSVKMADWETLPHPVGNVPSSSTTVRDPPEELIADARVSFLRRSIGICDAFLKAIESKPGAAP